MRTPIVAGNWKMNGGPRQASELAIVLRDGLQSLAGIETVVFPPFISIPTVQALVAGTSLQLGAQNCSDQPNGAYTGEISAAMLAELCQWVILGHSERRSYYGESDELVNHKIQAALGAGLRPIVCVGERLEDREANLTERIISGQVAASLAAVRDDQIAQLVIAYEPIWAIGTGLAATRRDAEDVIALIRALIYERFGTTVAENLRILYGGSVTVQNILEFASSPAIDGALVGGASLKAEFIDIARAIANTKQASD